jgi:hypothetical protein
MQGEASTRFGFTDYFRVDPRLSDKFWDSLPFHRQECVA